MVTAGTDDVTEGTRLKLPGAGASTTCEIRLNEVFPWVPERRATVHVPSLVLAKVPARGLPVAVTC